jgi:hypothetical protein
VKQAVFSVLAVLSVLAGPVWSATRYDQFTERFRKSPDQIPVVTATFFGGAGTEWFAAGGVQPDGTIVAAGVSLGPVLAANGVQVKVLGRDTAAPVAPERIVRKNKKGEPELNKDGTPKCDPFRWTHENATGFIVRYAPDLKSIVSVSRFPWCAGSITGAAIDAEGNIYLSGSAGKTFAALGNAAELKAGDLGEVKDPACTHTYLAKLNPDASSIVWCKQIRAPSCAPDVRVTKDGKLSFQGPDLRTFSLNGELLRTTVVPGGLGNRIAVNPMDGTYAKGGEHQWPTGREPWRDPILNIYKPDGSWLYELYNWDGFYAGLDSLRLVSDSAIRAVRYDNQGNLIFYAWSDGGNSVMYREPNDIRCEAKAFKGLGMSAWGAGVLSCAYLVKIETTNYKVAGGTLWLAYLKDKDKPNSIWIDALGFADDGSVCFAGHSAWGLIQTGNHLNGDGEPAGPYVAILSPDCASLRFSSAVAGAGKTDVANGETWGIASASAKGRKLILYFTAAEEKESIYDKVKTPPTVNPVQATFGGGHTDAYLMVLNAGAAKTEAKP